MKTICTIALILTMTAAVAIQPGYYLSGRCTINGEPSIISSTVVAFNGADMVVIIDATRDNTYRMVLELMMVSVTDGEIVGLMTDGTRFVFDGRLLRIESESGDLIVIEMERVNVEELRG